VHEGSLLAGFAYLWPHSRGRGGGWSQPLFPGGAGSAHTHISGSRLNQPWFGAEQPEPSAPLSPRAEPQTSDNTGQGHLTGPVALV
jgi:hypothetical protein